METTTFLTEQANWWKKTRKMWKVNWSTWHQRGTKKKSESLPGVLSRHWATKTHWQQGNCNWINMYRIDQLECLSVTCDQPSLFFSTAAKSKGTPDHRLACPVFEVRHEFDSCRRLRFFFALHSCHVDKFTFHISLPSLKFTIFIHLLITTRKMFWKTYPSRFTVKWNTVEPPTGNLLQTLQNQWTAYESLVI